MSGKGKHTKSKKRKVTDACSICIGRGRIEESKNVKTHIIIAKFPPYIRGGI